MKLYQIAVYDQLKEQADTIEEAVAIYHRLKVAPEVDVYILKCVNWKTDITDITETPNQGVDHHE